MKLVQKDFMKLLLLTDLEMFIYLFICFFVSYSAKEYMLSLCLSVCMLTFTRLRKRLCFMFVKLQRRLGLGQ